MWKKFAIAALGLSTLGAAVHAAVPSAGAWEIGPFIRGKDYSIGMPAFPTQRQNGTWSFDFPAGSASAGHVHYVSFAPGALAGKSKIVVRYRVKADAATRFVPQQHPDREATVSLYLQRRGDDWSGKGQMEYFRWYAPSDSVQALSPGVHTMTVSLDDPAWTSVLGTPARDAPEGFDAALAQTAKVGLVFGSSHARGHGVFATAPAQFRLIDFRIE